MDNNILCRIKDKSLLIIKNIGKKERRQGLFKNRKTAFDISQK